MKKYSTNNGTDWLVADDVILSEQQLDILKNGTEEEKNILIEEIKYFNQAKACNQKELAFCLSVYSKYKPEIKENDIYSLISFNFTGENEVVKGAYNFKINNTINNVIL
jgi:hypothetical protein